MRICAHFSLHARYWGVFRQSIWRNALFLFFITGGVGWVQGGHPLAQVTLWIWMCMENCLVQRSTLHSKRPFFNPRVSHPLARTLLPSKTLSLPPPRLQNPSSFLPCFPWPLSKFFMWLDWGRLEVDPCPSRQKTLVFQEDESVLVLAGWTRGLEGSLDGGGWNSLWERRK